MKTFRDFLSLKEQVNPAEIKLSDDSDFKPFVVDKANHPNLRYIIKAFQDSPNTPISPNLTVLDKKGEIEPKLKKKQLFLTGGSVRDHLKDKTPKSYHLVTDATPAEIKLILKNAGFKENKEGNKVFYSGKTDRQGKEHQIIVKINKEEFDISTMHKGSKSKKPLDKVDFTANPNEDAQGRDFTVNALYIPLTNADGPNAKLIDPHAGAKDLANNEIKFIGNPKDHLKHDQTSALKFITLNHEPPEEVRRAIKNVKDLNDVPREEIKSLFVKGLEAPDTDPKKYIKIYKELGLLDSVFPGMVFDEPSDKKDKRLAIAWILKNNDPTQIEEMLKLGTWDNREINDILHLIKMHHWGKKYKKDDSFYHDFYDMKQNLHNKTSLVPSLIKNWGKMSNLDPEMLNSYLNHELTTKSYVRDSFGGRTVNPELTQLFGKTPEGNQFGLGVKHLETEKFRKQLNKE